MKKARCGVVPAGGDWRRAQSLSDALLRHSYLPAPGPRLVGDVLRTGCSPSLSPGRAGTNKVRVTAVKRARMRMSSMIVSARTGRSMSKCDELFQPTWPGPDRRPVVGTPGQYGARVGPVPSFSRFWDDHRQHAMREHRWDSGPTRRRLPAEQEGPPKPRYRWQVSGSAHRVTQRCRSSQTVSAARGGLRSDPWSLHLRWNRNPGPPPRCPSDPPPFRRDCLRQRREGVQPQIGQCYLRLCRSWPAVHLWSDRDRLPIRCQAGQC